MSERNTSLKVNSQFPEFFREEYQLFIKFVSEYYNYLDTTYSGKIDQVRDVDLANNLFLEHFRSTFCPTLPNFEYVDLKFFIKHAREFYRSKGTIDSVKFLFRALFNENVEIYYPGEYLLKSQDGIWEQEYFITVQKESGSLPIAGSVRIEFAQGVGVLYITPSRIEDLWNGVVRFYFKPETKYNFNIGLAIFVYNTSLELIYTGKVIPQAGEISVIKPGKYWILGQAFKIRGSNKDTICRVTKVDSEGGIAAVEILEHGYTHNLNQITAVQPYKNRPNDDTIVYEKTLTQFTPLAYNHSLTIKDQILGLSDSFVAILINDDYVTSGYVDVVYFGTIAATQSSNLPPVDEGLLDLDVTTERWLESIAHVSFKPASMVKTKGRWLSDSGIISNESIILQDNDVYQVYSYQIETTKDISEYKTVICEVHPVGFRLYSTLNKAFNHKELYGVSRVRSYDTLFFSDSITDLNDHITDKDILKLRYDQQTATDSIEKNIAKITNQTTQLVDPGSNTDVLAAPDYTEPDYLEDVDTYIASDFIVEHIFESLPPTYVDPGYVNVGYI